MSPYNGAGIIDESSMSLIRENIQFLHEYLLGERLTQGAAELQISEQLFMGTLNRGRQILLNNGSSSSNRNLPYDCDRTRDFEGVDLEDDDQIGARLVEDRQYVIRSWMAVVAYLLADYKFLYN